MPNKTHRRHMEKSLERRKKRKYGKRGAKGKKKTNRCAKYCSKSNVTFKTWGGRQK